MTGAVKPRRPTCLLFFQWFDGRIRRPMLRARLAVAGLGVAVIVSACGSSNVDAHRLAILSRDPVATAQAPGTTPWLHQGSAGSGNGIGFGGMSPTVLNVVRRLQGPKSSVARYYAERAIRSGWRVYPIKCYRSYDSISASKQFPGWTAHVDVAVSFAYKGVPAVVITFETDYHGAPSPTVLSPPVVAPLTVQRARTNLSRLLAVTRSQLGHAVRCAVVVFLEHD